MIATQKITVNLNDKTDRPSIDVVQGDGARALEVVLYAGNEVWTVPAGVSVLIRYQNSDGTGGCYDSLSDGTRAYSISGNTVTVLLAPEAMCVSGVTQLQVVLRSGDAALAAFTVNMTVEPDYSLSEMESGGYVNLSVWIRDELDQRMAQSESAGSYVWGTTDDLHQRYDPVYAVGSLDDVGLEIAAGNQIRSGYIRTAGRRMTVTFPEGVKVRCFYYDEDKNFLRATGFYETSFNRRSSACFVRCVAAYTDELPVTDVSALTAKVGLFFLSDSHDPYRGKILDLRNTCFEDCYDDGYYQFTEADLESITDAPPIRCGGILEVRAYAGDDAVLQTITTEDGEVWFRRDAEDFRRILPQEISVESNIVVAQVLLSGGVYSLVDSSYASLLAAVEAGKDVRLMLPLGTAQTRYYHHTLTHASSGYLVFSYNYQNTMDDIAVYSNGTVKRMTGTTVGASRKINGHALSADVTLTPEDLGITMTMELRQIGQKIVSGEISRIILMGDSVTDGYGGTGYNGSKIKEKSTNTAGYCWANALKKYLSGTFGTTVENYGCYGATAAEQVAAVEDILTAEDFVIWLSGADDRSGAAAFSDYEANLASYIATVRSKAGELLLLSCVPAAEMVESCSYKTALDINRVIAKALPEETLYLDMYSEYIHRCAAEGIAVDDTMYDYTYPDDTGHHMILRILCAAIGLPLRAHTDYSQTGDWWNGWELLMNTGLDDRRSSYPFTSWNEATVPLAMFCWPNSSEMATRFTGETLRKIVLGGDGFAAGTLSVGILNLATVAKTLPVLENTVTVTVGADGVIDFGEEGFTIPAGYTLGIGAVSDTATVCYVSDSYVNSSNWILWAENWKNNSASYTSLCAAFYRKV